MTTAAATVTPIAWWKEPTKDQWYAYVAAWAGWTLDALDFTAFLLIIAPIAKEFDVPVPEVAAVLTITLWMRLLGATASGWLADRIGRKTPLMISIAWYSVCNFLAGSAPSFFCCSSSGRCSASAWAQNGRPAPPSQWRPGRCVRVASWAP
jgi:SHS family lactate transporter-like MFS transporter